ncbi:Protein fantom [Nymphon striatum]|nr:Protein fantom [Nymphon striatum]
MNYLLGVRDQFDRKIVIKFDRSELEDKYLRLHEENIELKKIALTQKDKIKRLGTKFLRLIEDKKKLEGGVPGRKEEIQLEEIIQDLQDKNRELTKQNKLIKEKLIVTKQQLATHGKRSTPYNHIASRVDTGHHRSSSIQGKVSPAFRFRDNQKYKCFFLNKRNFLDENHYFDVKSIFRIGRASPLPKYGLSLLEEARAENRNMEEAIQSLREQTYILEQENESLREQMKMKVVEYSEEVANLKSQMTMGQRKSIQGNVDMIRYQRELKQKTTQLISVEQDRDNMAQKIELLKASNQDLLSDVERLNKQLQDSQNKNLDIDSHLKKKTALERSLQQCEEQIICLKKENLIFNETNEKLMNSVVDVRPSKENSIVEQTLRAQVSKLQAMLANDSGETHKSPDRHIVVEKISENNEALQELQQTYAGLMVRHNKIIVENEEMSEKASMVDVSDIEQALSVVKLNKELNKAPVADENSLQKQIKALEAQNIETVNELEKTRNMLILQHRINCDYQAEVETINQQKKQLQLEFETRIQEYAKLLDIRAARIQKLEFQLKDIAYGTKQYPITDAINNYEMNETIQLERGQNIFELHLDKVSLSSEVLHILQDKEPSTFLTWAFYDYQLHTTSVMKGSRPEFNCTTQYIIRADDSFLEYLFKIKTTVELHVATGVDYLTVGICHLDFRPLVDDTQTRYHGKAKIFSSEKTQENIVMGMLEFWCRLKIPMEQAVRLFKERGKALGYIAVNRNTTRSALSILNDGKEEEKDDHVNELHVKIIRCNNLKPILENHQPSAYCVYKWNNSYNYDTEIIPASNHPEFNDHNVVEVGMNMQLDDFLKTKKLQIFIFDDADSASNGFIGVANVPLLSLIHNKAIDGTFEIFSDNGTTCGTIDLCIYFQYTYLTSVGLQSIPPPPPLDQEQEEISPSTQIRSEPQLVSQEPHILKDLSTTIVAGDSKTVPQSKPQPKPRGSGPTAVSTPIASKKPREENIPHPSPRALRFLESAESGSPSKQPNPPKAPPRQSNLKSRGNSKEKTLSNNDESTSSTPLRKTDKPREERNSLTSKGSPLKSVSTPSRSESSPFKTQVSPTKSISSTKSPINLKQAGLSEKVTGCKDPLELSDDGNIKNELHVYYFFFDSMKEDLKASAADSPINSSESEKMDEKQEVAVVNKKTFAHKDSASTSESDEVVVKPLVTLTSPTRLANAVTIVIHHLTLLDGSTVSSNDAIQMIFVEYKFLNFPPEELETPFALPKPKPGQKIAFHFHKVFHLDAQNNYQRRQMLAAMLLPDESDIIQFTVVSEPPESREQEMECEDVGNASINLKNRVGFIKQMRERILPQVLVIGHDDGFP